jgi:xylulokinase
MWLEAVDLVLQRMKEQGLDFGLIHGVSGAGMQHGTVFWSKEAESLLKNLDSSMTLLEQLEKEKTSAFAHPHSPNWQDASTQVQCDEYDAILGDPETLAKVTGSKAHHVSGFPQQLHYLAYPNTAF